MLVSHVDDFAFCGNARFQTEVIEQLKSIFKVGLYANGSFNPLHAAVEKSGQCGTSSSHGGRENSTEKHQPVSEGISWEPRIVSSHTAPQKIAKKISFQMAENDMMVA